MSTNTIILLVAAGAVGYFLLKGKKAEAAQPTASGVPGQTSPSGNPTLAFLGGLAAGIVGSQIGQSN